MAISMGIILELIMATTMETIHEKTVEIKIINIYTLNSINFCQNNNNFDVFK
jgi:hypothetical protein